MPLKRKAFVVAAGKEHEGAFIDRQESMLAQRRPVPKIEELLRLPGVRKSPKGIIINQSIMGPVLFDRVYSIADALKPQRSHNRANLERLSLIRQLRSLGFRVATPRYVLHPNNILRRAEIPNRETARKFSKYSRVFSAKAPYFETPSGSLLAPASFWARDLWKKMDGKRVYQFSARDKPNAFGEGGESVDISDKAIIANVELKNNPTTAKFQAKGVKFYFVNSGEEFDRSLSSALKRAVYSTNSHPDLFLGIVGKVMLVNNDFFRQNRDTLKQAIRENGLKPVFTPEDEVHLHPANFLVLSQNRILVDRAARKTIALLRDQGVEVIPTKVSLDACRLSGGSVRCLVNEL